MEVSVRVVESHNKCKVNLKLHAKSSSNFNKGMQKMNKFMMGVYLLHVHVQRSFKIYHLFLETEFF